MVWLFQTDMAKLALNLFSILTRQVALSLALLLLFAGAGQSAVVTVVSSGGFAAAYRALAPVFERTTGNTLVTSWGPSMGNTPDAAVPTQAPARRIDRCGNHGRQCVWAI